MGTMGNLQFSRSTAAAVIALAGLALGACSTTQSPQVDAGPSAPPAPELPAGELPPDLDGEWPEDHAVPEAADTATGTGRQPVEVSPAEDALSPDPADADLDPQPEPGEDG